MLCFLKPVAILCTPVNTDFSICFSLLLIQASSVAALLDGGVSGTPLATASIVCVAQSPAVDVVAVGLR